MPCKGRTADRCSQWRQSLEEHYLAECHQQLHRENTIHFAHESAGRAAPLAAAQTKASHDCGARHWPRGAPRAQQFLRIKPARGLADERLLRRSAHLRQRSSAQPAWSGQSGAPREPDARGKRGGERGREGERERERERERQGCKAGQAARPVRATGRPGGQHLHPSVSRARQSATSVCIVLYSLGPTAVVGATVHVLDLLVL